MIPPFAAQIEIRLPEGLGKMGKPITIVNTESWYHIASHFSLMSFHTKIGSVQVETRKFFIEEKICRPPCYQKSLVQRSDLYRALESLSQCLVQPCRIKISLSLERRCNAVNTQYPPTWINITKLSECRGKAFNPIMGQVNILMSKDQNVIFRFCDGGIISPSRTRKACLGYHLAPGVDSC